MKNKILNIMLIVFLFSCNGNRNEELKSQAYKYYDEDQYAKADSLFRLIKVDSSDLDFFYKRAVTYGNLNEIKLSNDFFEFCIKNNYRLEGSYLGKGLNEFSEFNNSGALLYFKKVLSINPDNIKAKLMIEECKERKIIDESYDTISVK